MTTALSFTELMILTSRFRALERIQFSLEKMEEKSTDLVSTLLEDSPLAFLKGEEASLAEVANACEHAYSQAMSNLSRVFPSVFTEEGVLTDLGEDLVLVTMAFSNGSFFSILETMMMLYAITIKDFKTKEESEEASTFLIPALSTFTQKFLGGASKKSNGKITLTEEAQERIEMRLKEMEEKGDAFALATNESSLPRVLH